MKIYLDNCCFNRPSDDQTQLKIHLESQAKLFIQQQIISQEYELVWQEDLFEDLTVRELSEKDMEYIKDNKE